MQLQVSLPKKIVITAVIMFALILLVFYCDIPNPNMILIAGLVLCSALFGYGGGIVAAVIMLGYTLFFFPRITASRSLRRKIYKRSSFH